MLSCPPQLMEYFVEEYFDQNPISQVRGRVFSRINKVLAHIHVCICFSSPFLSLQIGIITTKNKRAEKLTDLAGE